MAKDNASRTSWSFWTSRTVGVLASLLLSLALLLPAQTQPPLVAEDAAAAARERIRGLIRADDFEAAKDAAVAAHKAFPADSTIRSLVGDTFYHLADFENAYRFYMAAVEIDKQNARAFLGAGRCMDSQFRRKTAVQSYQRAFELDPQDPEIIRAYLNTVRKRSERIALLTKYLSLAKDLPDFQREGASSTLEYLQNIGDRKGASLLSPVQPYTIKLQPLSRGPRFGVYGVGLRVALNDAKALTLLLDTGASGIMLNPKGAEKAGLDLVSNSKVGGIGANGLQASSNGIASVVKIGDLQYANLRVTSTARKLLNEVDGLIGADVFSRFLVELNMPNYTMTLTPLPPPGNATEIAESGETGLADDWSRYDREIPAGEEQFTPVRHIGHLLLVGTLVNKQKAGQFLIDTGANQNLLSASFGQGLTKIRSEDRVTINGISGKVKEVYTADRIRLEFAHFGYENPNILTVNMHEQDRHIGVAMSGIIGWPVLQQLIITINYRDGLVNLQTPAGAHR